jgi:hypothetical protein
LKPRGGGFFLLGPIRIVKDLGRVKDYNKFLRFLMGNTAEDLAKRWENFSLTKEEIGKVEIGAEDLEEITNKGKFYLVGKLIAD